MEATLGMLSGFAGDAGRLMAGPVLQPVDEVFVVRLKKVKQRKEIQDCTNSVLVSKVDIMPIRAFG